MGHYKYLSSNIKSYLSIGIFNTDISVPPSNLPPHKPSSEYLLKPSLIQSNYPCKYSILKPPRVPSSVPSVEHYGHPRYITQYVPTINLSIHPSVSQRVYSYHKSSLVLKLVISRCAYTYARLVDSNIPMISPYAYPSVNNYIYPISVPSYVTSRITSRYPSIVSVTYPLHNTSSIQPFFPTGSQNTDRNQTPTNDHSTFPYTVSNVEQSCDTNNVLSFTPSLIIYKSYSYYPITSPFHNLSSVHLLVSSSITSTDPITYSGNKQST